MRKLSVFPVLAAALTLTGCNIEFDGSNNEKFQQDFRFSYPLKSGAAFTLENRNGSVDIAGWDREEVEITGVKYARTEALRDELKIDIQHSEKSVAIRTVTPSDSNGGVGARYVIRVPRRIILERVINSNGKLHASDIDGAVHLKTSNGSVELTKIKGDADAQTSNGAVEANGIDGAVHLHTTNGHVTAEGITGAIDATSSNGSLTLTLIDNFKNGVQARTTNSSITIRVPATLAARVRASTSNGNISSEFNNVQSDHENRHRMDGPINGGGASSPLLDLTTSNGSIKFEKL